MIQNIFIFGAKGKVGRTLVKQIFEMGDTDESKHKNPTRIVALAGRKLHVVNPEGISYAEASRFTNDPFYGRKHSHLYEIIDKLSQMNNRDSGLIGVDTTASLDIHTFHQELLEYENFGVVTANKNPISMTEFDLFNKLTSNVGRYGYRCSVMAGAEAVSLIQDLRDLNDLPINITGCFSGTLGYICTELKPRKPLSEIVREAVDRRYAEPHPRDDLNGNDVGKKMLILARTAGYPVEFSDLKIEPFIPQEYLMEEDVSKFMKNLKELDLEYDKKVRDAERNDSVLRYVARMTTNGDINNLEISITAGLEEVKKDTSFALLNGTLNQISIVSGIYSQEAPYQVKAPGAGLDHTALNIRRDLLHMLKGRQMAESDFRRNA